MRLATATICLVIMLLSSSASSGTGANATPDSVSPSPRYALVIGNSAYTHSPSLKNPVNDAALISTALQTAGFQVTQKTDLNFKAMRRTFQDFSRKLAAQPKAVGLFYFAGHGTQVAGQNYLLPVDARVESEADIEAESINARALLSRLEFAGNALNIIILDACRNNPFTRGSRVLSQGFSRMDAPSGAVIAYSTQPGNVAADGMGAHSPYAVELASAIGLKGQLLEQVFKHVRRGVAKATGGRQTPWEETSLLGDFYFYPPDQPSKAQVAHSFSPPPQHQQIKAEVAFWDSIKNSQNSAMFLSYLQQFPRGVFAGLAKIQLSTLTPTESEKTKWPPLPLRRAPRGPLKRNVAVPVAATAPFSNSVLAVMHAPKVVPNRHAAPPGPQQGEGEERCVLLNDDISYCASSVLPSRTGRYGVGNLLDGRDQTAWIEGHPGQGLGERITVKFRMEKKVRTIRLKNGYSKTPKMFYRNGRITKALIEFSGGQSRVLPLGDVPGFQDFDIDPPVAARWISLKILAVTDGNAHKDTALNELRVITVP